jgi:hypothetical protein
MMRLCDRPACSDSGVVAYGMRPADLVFWLDVLRPEHDDVGVLCRRHADAMVVPRYWTLDDLRDPDLHLFRPPSVERTARRTARRPRRADDTEQLRLGVQVAAEEPAVGAPSFDPPDGPRRDAPWSPDFDPHDDLNGLLSARGPLLARAFRGGGGQVR